MKKLFERKERVSNINIEENKERFVQIWNNNVHRQGADRLLAYLQKTDFFEAPASTKFHNNVAGGLCQHTLLVYYQLLSELRADGYALDDQQSESAAIVALTHDICKTNFYKSSSRNIKVNGTWRAIPWFEIDEALPFGHGEKSVYIIQNFMRLTTEEALSIRWHMGDFSEAFGGCGKAYSMFPLAIYLHIADLKASHLVENTFDYEQNSWKEI